MVAGPAWDLTLESDAWTYRSRLVPVIDPDGTLAFTLDGDARARAGTLLHIGGTLRVGPASGPPGIAETIGQVRDAAVDVARDLPRAPVRAAAGAIGYAFGFAQLAVDRLQGTGEAKDGVELLVVADGASHFAPATLDLDAPAGRVRGTLVATDP